MRKFLKQVAMSLFLGLVAGAAFHVARISAAKPVPVDVPKEEEKSNWNTGGLTRLHNKDGSFFCSGFVVSSTKAITAAHCLEGMLIGITPITVKDRAGNQTEATAMAYERRSDQGLIGGDFSKFVKRKIIITPALIEEAFHDNHLVICGFPYGGQLACATFEFEQHQFFFFEGHSFAYPGMSGGAVIDTRNNRVVGIISATDREFTVIAPLVEIYSNLLGNRPNE